MLFSSKKLIVVGIWMYQTVQGRSVSDLQVALILPVSHSHNYGIQMLFVYIPPSQSVY